MAGHTVLISELEGSSSCIKKVENEDDDVR